MSTVTNNGRITTIRYVRDHKNRRVGMLLGLKGESPSALGISRPAKVFIGWSLCRRGDQFDKYEGVKVAIRNVRSNVPPSILPQAKDFRIQCFQAFGGSAVEDIWPMPIKHIPRKASSKWVRNAGHRVGCLLNSQKVGTCSCASLAAKKSSEPKHYLAKR